MAQRAGNGKRAASKLLDNRADARKIDATGLAVPIHPDCKRPPNQLIFRHEAPEAPVLAIIAIIAHHEIVPCRHLKITIAARAMVAMQQHMLASIKGFAQHLRAGVIAAPANPNVDTSWLHWHRLAVHEDLFVVVADPITGQADDAFDPVLIGMVRRPEYHHITALGLAQLDELGVEHRQAQAIAELVDQDEIANQKRGHH